MKEQLYVYVFDSATEVERGLKQINNQNALYDIAHTPTPYIANNILIMSMRYLPIPGVEGKIQAAVDVLSGKDTNISKKKGLSEPPLPIISVEGKQVTMVRVRAAGRQMGQENAQI